MFMFYFINYISLLIFTYICILQPKNLSYGTIRKATLTGCNERYYYCRNDHGKQSGNLGVCIYPTSPRIMERFDTDRSGISVLYVHYGRSIVFIHQGKSSSLYDLKSNEVPNTLTCASPLFMINGLSGFGVTSKKPSPSISIIRSS